MNDHKHTLVGPEVHAFSNAMIAAYDVLKDGNGDVSPLKMLRVSAALYGQMRGASSVRALETCPDCDAAVNGIISAHTRDGMLRQAKIDGMGIG